MKNKVKQTILKLILTGIIAASLSGCFSKSANTAADIDSIKSYLDIPGITDEEIAAIKAFQAEGRVFSYESIKSVEAFSLPDGSKAGFSALFCGLLSELFGIPFIQKESLSW